MLQPIVDLFAKWLTRRPGVILGVITLLVGLALLSVRGLKFSTDLFAMAPPDAKVVHTFREVNSRFGGNLFVVVHQVDGKETQLPEATEAVARRLTESDLFTSVRWQVTQEEVEQIREHLRSHVFAYRSPEEEPRIKELLDPESIQKRVRQIKGLLLTPFTPQAAVLRAADPLRSESMTLKTSGSLQVKAGPLLSADGTAALILTEPKSYPQNLDFSRKVITLVHQLDQDMSADGAHPARVEGFGAHMTVFQYGAGLQDDLLPSAISSVVGVTLVFFLLYRSVSIAIFTALALVAGIALSLAVSVPLLGQLSPFTIGISALLAGTGIDHSVHIFNRYLEERKGGSTAPVADSIRSVGVGIVVAAGTNAFAFLPMIASGFGGIHDFGVAGAIGVPLILISILMVVPTLMQLQEARRPSRGRALEINVPTLKKAQASWMLLAGTLACIVLAPFALHVKFDMNINSFRVPDPEYNKARDELMGKFGLSGKTSVEWVLTGTDLPALLDQNDQITALLETHRGKGHALTHVESLSTLLPGPALQEKRLGKVDQATLQTAYDTLVASCASEGLSDVVCDPSRKILAGGLAGERITYEDLEKGGFADLLKPFIQKNESGWMLVGKMWPSGAEDGNIAESLAREIESHGPNVTVVGPVRGNEELKAFFHRDLAKVSGFAAAGILIMLLLQYPKQPRHLILCLLPVSMGLLIFVGMVSLLDFDFGLLSLVTLPLIVGTSVDSAVHLTHHLDTDEGYSVRDILNTTGRAVLVCSLSNAIGCASNALTSNPQVREMGILSAMGILTCLITSLTIWPALAILLFPHRAEGGSHHSTDDDEIDALQKG